MAAAGPLEGLSGPFHLDELAIRGDLHVEAGPTPGVVHVHADMAYALGGALHYDAVVRESWVERAGEDSVSSDARERIARELVALASLPRQSTVTVSF